MMFEDVALLQGDAALNALTILEHVGEYAALCHMRDTYYKPGTHSVIRLNGALLPTKLYRHGAYILQYSKELQYVSLIHICPDENEDIDAIPIPGGEELLDKERRQWYFDELKRLNHDPGGHGDRSEGEYQAGGVAEERRSPPDE